MPGCSVCRNGYRAGGLSSGAVLTCLLGAVLPAVSSARLNIVAAIGVD
jgi:hypothetical protein